jgi:hypothetical protein
MTTKNSPIADAYFEEDDEDEEDVEPTKKEIKYERGDFPSMVFDLGCKINFKVALLLFIVGLFIFSDVFINQVISSFSNCTDMGMCNTKGTMLQLGFLCLAYVIIDLLVATDFL